MTKSLPGWLDRMTEVEAKQRVMKDYEQILRYRARAEKAEHKWASARTAIVAVAKSLDLQAPNVYDNGEINEELVIDEKPGED